MLHFIAMFSNKMDGNNGLYIFYSASCRILRFATFCDLAIMPVAVFCELAILRHEILRLGVQSQITIIRLTLKVCKLAVSSQFTTIVVDIHCECEHRQKFAFYRTDRIRNEVPGLSRERSTLFFHPFTTGTLCAHHTLSLFARLLGCSAGRPKIGPMRSRLLFRTINAGMCNMCKAH